jgi:hypothetical protein
MDGAPTVVEFEASHPFGTKRRIDAHTLGSDGAHGLGEPVYWLPWMTFVPEAVLISKACGGNLPLRRILEYWKER